MPKEDKGETIPLYKTSHPQSFMYFHSQNAYKNAIQKGSIRISYFAWEKQRIRARSPGMWRTNYTQYPWSSTAWHNIVKNLWLPQIQSAQTERHQWNSLRQLPAVAGKTTSWPRPSSSSAALCNFACFFKPPRQHVRHSLHQWHVGTLLT